MRFLFLFGLSSILLLSVNVVSQPTENCIIVQARVLWVPPNDYAEGVKPSESSSRVVKLKILETCDDGLDQQTIKVAYRAGAEQELSRGQRLSIVIRPTNDYRVVANFLQKDVGVVIPEDSIADFEFVAPLDLESNVGNRRHSSLDSCSARFCDRPCSRESDRR